MSASKSYVTDPFHPLGSTYNKSFLHIYQSVPVLFSNLKVCLGTVLFKNTEPKVISTSMLNVVRSGAYRYKIKRSFFMCTC